jgi:hypothetical protein
MKERKNERKKDFLFYYSPPPSLPQSDKEENYSIFLFLFFKMPLQNHQQQQQQQQLNIYYCVWSIINPWPFSWRYPRLAMALPNCDSSKLFHIVYMTSLASLDVLERFHYN